VFLSQYDLHRILRYLFGAGYWALSRSSDSALQMADTDSEALDTPNLDAEVASVSGVVTQPAALCFSARNAPPPPTLNTGSDGGRQGWVVRTR